MPCFGSGSAFAPGGVVAVVGVVGGFACAAAAVLLCPPVSTESVRGAAVDAVEESEGVGEGVWVVCFEEVVVGGVVVVVAVVLSRGAAASSVVDAAEERREPKWMPSGMTAGDALGSLNGMWISK